MYLEKRPTNVTVIGWVWIVLGTLMFLSAVMGLFASMMADEMMKSQGEMNGDMPLMFRLFPAIAIFQIGFAVLGFVAGTSLLKLKAWARAVLEIQTWVLLVFLVGFMIIWMAMWASMAGDVAPDGFSLLGLVMGVAITAIYVIPLGFMLRSLRGETVKSAIASAPNNALERPNES